MDDTAYHSAESQSSNKGWNASRDEFSSRNTGVDGPYVFPRAEYVKVMTPPEGTLALFPLTGSSFSLHPSHTSSSKAHITTLLEQALFFGTGLGSSLCYIATLSSLVHFKLLYGADSFVYLNTAVYLPLLPIALAQARWDQDMDVRYTSQVAFFVRGVIGFALGLLGTIQMIRGDGNPESGLSGLMINALLQGTGGAILYGTLNQLASFVGADDGPQMKAAVSSGVQASAFVVLALSFITGFGSHDATKFPVFLWNIVFVKLLCFVAFVWLLLGRPTVAEAMMRRDSSLQCDDHIDRKRTPLAVDSTQSYYCSPTVELSFVELVRNSRSCCFVLVVTLIPSFLVGSWFTRIQSEWMELASWLFYIRIASDFLGRLATITFPPRSTSVLTGACLLRLVPVVLFFFNAHRPLPLADGLSIVLVAIIAFLSGYLVTGCFQLAPLGLNLEFREANLAKQASLLTVAFSASATVGLLSSFILMALGV